MSVSWKWLRKSHRMRSFIYKYKDRFGKGSVDKLFSDWHKFIEFGGTLNNTIHVYHNGEKMFHDFWKAIDEAKQSVHVETYTISPDQTGTITINKLIEAAKRGCSVKLIKDGFGSNAMKPEHVQPLIDAGAEVYTFNEKSLRYINFLSRERISTPWHRDHRKCAVIDNKIGFCGGMNIEDKYSLKGHYETVIQQIKADERAKTIQIGPSSVETLSISSEDYNYEWFYDPVAGIQDPVLREKFSVLKTAFRDTHCRITGPSVAYLADSFFGTIEEVTAEKTSPLKSLARYIKATREVFTKKNESILDKKQEEEEDEEEDKFVENGVYMMVLASSPRHGRRQLVKAIQWMTDYSKKNIYIVTPYFLPPKQLVECILSAKDRGCEVHIITCGLSDVKPMRLGCIGLYGKFLKRGVHIYEYNKQTLHAKYMTSDGKFSLLGSFNMDRMSMLSNRELGLGVIDEATAKGLELQFVEDLKHSTELTYDTWQKRPLYLKIVGWVLYKMMRLLGP
ncbi:cardiolipin synthase YwiE [Acrasis kona]|uniref:Cardiolipin synthase YwiE n=1 Tax=Acrasis kona TaxID=1008807 RepID=A0AAW2Z632_9EUKA